MWQEHPEMGLGVTFIYGRAVSTQSILSLKAMSDAIVDQLLKRSVQVIAVTS
jgi:hypothetical protein